MDDPNFCDEMIKAIQLGVRIGMSVGRGLLWVSRAGRKPDYRRLHDEQKRADRLDFSGRKQTRPTQHYAEEEEES